MINSYFMPSAKVIIISAILLLAIVNIFAYNKHKNSNPKIKIGTILPLTGPLSSYGEAFRNGMIMAREEQGSQANDYEIIFEDNAYDPKKAISAFLKLKQTDKADIILNWGDATSYAVAPVVTNNPVPFLAAGATNTDLARFSPYLIRYFDRAGHLTDRLWEYFRKNNIKNIGVVKTEIVFFNKMYEVLDKGKKDGEIVELFDNFLSPAEMDFRASLTKIKNTKKQFDAVGVFLVYGQSAQFYKQAKELGLNFATFGADSGYEALDLSSGLFEGAVYPDMGVSDEFKEAFEKKFGNIFQITHTAQGYDIVKMLLTKVDFANPEAVMRSLKQIKNFPGAAGPYSYRETNEDRYFESPTYLKQIQGNHIKIIK